MKRMGKRLLALLISLVSVGMLAVALPSVAEAWPSSNNKTQITVTVKVDGKEMKQNLNIYPLTDSQNKELVKKYNTEYDSKHRNQIDVTKEPSKSIYDILTAIKNSPASNAIIPTVVPNDTKTPLYADAQAHQLLDDLQAYQRAITNQPLYAKATIDLHHLIKNNNNTSAYVSFLGDRIYFGDGTQIIAARTNNPTTEVQADPANNAASIVFLKTLNKKPADRSDMYGSTILAPTLSPYAPQVDVTIKLTSEQLTKYAQGTTVHPTLHYSFVEYQNFSNGTPHAHDLDSITSLSQKNSISNKYDSLGTVYINDIRRDDAPQVQCGKQDDTANTVERSICNGNFAVSADIPVKLNTQIPPNNTLMVYNWQGTGVDKYRAFVDPTQPMNIPLSPEQLTTAKAQPHAVSLELYACQPSGSLSPQQLSAPPSGATALVGNTGTNTVGTHYMAQQLPFQYGTPIAPPIPFTQGRLLATIDLAKLPNPVTARYIDSLNLETVFFPQEFASIPTASGQQAAVISVCPKLVVKKPAVVTTLPSTGAAPSNAATMSALVLLLMGAVAAGSAYVLLAKRARANARMSAASAMSTSTRVSANN